MSLLDHECFADVFPAEIATALKDAGLRNKENFEKATLAELGRIPGVDLYTIAQIVAALSEAEIAV